MRNILLIILLLTSPCVASGYGPADVFNRNIPITWLGLDCTQMTITGSAYQVQQAGKLDDRDIQDKYIPAWNKLIVEERAKYKIAEAVHRQSIEYDIEITDKVNAGIKRSFFDSPAEALNMEKIAKLVSKYDFEGHTGIGLLFFVETLDKEAGYASVWVTFIDMETKQVLLAERMKGAVGGFGFRNYWARAYYLVIEDIGTHWRRRSHEKGN